MTTTRPLLYALLWLLPHMSGAQQLQTGAHMTIPEGSAVYVNGNVHIQESFSVSGTLFLTGNLTDHSGMNAVGGRVVFGGQGGVQVISGEASTCLDHMEILPGASVHIDAQKRLTVHGLLTNHNGPDGLLLGSAAGSTASLIHYSDQVYASVQRYVPGSEDIMYLLSSPVLEQPIKTEFCSGDDLFFRWFEEAQTWVNIDQEFIYPTFTIANDGADYFLTGHAYMVRYKVTDPDEHIRVFSGLLHQGTISYTLSRKAIHLDQYPGYNMMGNPYPSAIDWSASEGWGGKEHLENDAPIHYKSAWIWNNDIKNFAVINPAAKTAGHNETPPYIPAMQGFWVQAAPGTDNEVITMDDRVRVHSDIPWHKEDVSDSLPGSVMSIVVTAIDKPWRDEVLVEFDHPLDGGASKMFSPWPGSPQLYVLHNEQPYSIRFVRNMDEPTTIQLGFTAGTYGEFSLSASHGKQVARKIVIEDKKSGKTITLPHEEPYPFTGGPDDDPQRFTIHLIR